MEEPAPAAPFEHLLDDVVKYARSAEKLIATAATLMPAATALGELRDYDPALEPEVAVAFAHVQEALAALTRASGFLDARFEASLDGMRASIDPPTEGE